MYTYIICHSLATDQLPPFYCWTALIYKASLLLLSWICYSAQTKAKSSQAPAPQTHTRIQ